jgi:hypothetical protein
MLHYIVITATGTFNSNAAAHVAAISALAKELSPESPVITIHTNKS